MNIGLNPIGNVSHAFLMMGTFGNAPGVASGVVVSVATANAGMAVLSPADAYWFDSKIDDAMPTSGKVQAIGFYQDTSQPSATRDLTQPYRGTRGTAVCIDNTADPNAYNTSYSGSYKTCNLMIEAAF